MSRWFRKRTDASHLKPAQQVEQVERVETSTAFAEFEQELLQQLDPQRVYALILQRAAELVRPLPVASGLLLLIDEAAQPLRLTSETIANADGWIVVAQTLGAYDIEKEWPLTNGTITRRALLTRKAQRILEVGDEGDTYKPSGEGVRSELNVPLYDGEILIGTIDMASPVRGGFTEQHEERITRLAHVAAKAIVHMESLERQLIHERHLAIVEQIQGILAQLTQAHTAADVDAVCKAVMDHILALVCQTTESVLGLVLVAQSTPKQSVPDLVVFAKQGDANPKAPQRWPITQGITGETFRLRLPRLDANIQVNKNGDASAEEFIDFFQGSIRSELAVPMILGNETLGVIDAESTAPHHYTRNHQQTLEFLARQAAFAYQLVVLAAKRARERLLAEISAIVRSGVGNLRTLTQIAEIEDQRASLRQTILQSAVDLLQLRKATLFIAAGVYHGDNPHADTEHGRLVEIASAPRPLLDEADRESISFQTSMSGTVFLKADPWVFNTRDKRPAEFHPQREQDTYEVRSGGVFPVFEGARPIGTLVLDADQEGQFSTENMDAAKELAAMLSEVTVAARLRIEEIQARQLSAFEQEIPQAHEPDLEHFLRRVFIYAAQLTGGDAAWGQYAAIRQYPVGAGRLEMRVEVAYSGLIDAGGGVVSDWVARSFDVYQPPVTSGNTPLFAQALEHKRGVLHVDIATSIPSITHVDALSDPDRVGAFEPHDAPKQGVAMPIWDQARAVICVPLWRSSLQEHTASDVIGMLTLASNHPARLNDSDLEVISHFAQTVALGLLNQDRLGDRRNFMAQIVHELLAVLGPLTDRATDAAKRGEDLLLQAPSDLNDAFADHMRSLTEVVDLAYLAQELMFASQDLFADNAEVRVDPDASLLMADLQTQLRTSIKTLADLRGKEAHWEPDQIPVDPRYAIVGGKSVDLLVKAALMQYVENALRYSAESLVEIYVGFQEFAGTMPTGEAPSVPHGIVVEVRSQGPLVPASERPFLFELGFRGSNTNPSMKGQGIGLYEVAQIAHRLGGQAYYRAEGKATNRFFFWLPQARQNVASLATPDDEQTKTRHA